LAKKSKQGGENLVVTQGATTKKAGKEDKRIEMRNQSSERLDCPEYEGHRCEKKRKRDNRQREKGKVRKSNATKKLVSGYRIN